MKVPSRRRDRQPAPVSELASVQLPSLAPPAAEGQVDVLAPEPEQGYRVRRSVGKARRGWYAPLAAPSPTTSRSAEVLNPALLAQASGYEGTLIGQDALTNSLVAYDPFTAYATGRVNSPNVIVIGAIGFGKSSCLKTVYVLRPLMFANRRVVVIDKKNRAGEGEYAELTRFFGSEPLRFVIGGGGTRINLMDPEILGGAVKGQFRLLRAIAELSNDSRPLDKWEQHALRVAHRATLRDFEHTGKVPVLADLIGRLGVDDPSFERFSDKARERIHQAGLGVGFLIEALLSDELSGLFDGPTSANVRLQDKLTTFDISQLPTDSPAASMVVMAANVWLMGRLRHGHEGTRTNFVAEEGWDLVDGPGGRLFKSNSKLARGLGLSNIAAIHRPGDIPKDSPAIAMIMEAETVHLYRQDRDKDTKACVRLFNLNAGSARLLEQMPTGEHLLKIGGEPELHVRHRRSPLEVRLTNTDEAMTTAGRR